MFSEVPPVRIRRSDTLFKYSGHDRTKMLRKSECISRKQTQNVFRGFDYSRAIGVPLNIIAVLHLHESSAQSPATIFRKIRHKYRDWQSYSIRSAGLHSSPMYVYTFEAPGNPHVNWALYIRPELQDEFFEKLPKWVAKVQGPLGPYDLRADVLDQQGYKSLANYMLKGCDPAFVDHFHLRSLYDKYGPQGVFYGQRAGVSPSFNKTARSNAGYDAKLRRVLRPSDATLAA